MLVNGEEVELTTTTTTTTPRVLKVVAQVLERLVARNDRVGSNRAAEPGTKCGLTSFNGARTPSISIGNYIERIYKYSSCSPSCMVVAFVYIDRLSHKHPYSLLLSLNVHRLLVTSVLVASKVLDDVHYNNAFFAKVGGISNAELNKLELELLFLLDFSVVVSSGVFESYCLHLEKETMGNFDQRIDRTMSNYADDESTEISVGDTLRSSSPPPNAID